MRKLVERLTYEHNVKLVFAAICGVCMFFLTTRLDYGYRPLTWAVSVGAGIIILFSIVKQKS